MADPATARPADPVVRLDNAAVRERLTRADEVLAQLEQLPDPVAAPGLAAVSALAAVYGEALARAVDHTAASPSAREALVADELVGHLLVLHGVHPEPVEQRVARTLDGLRAALAQGGVQATLERIDDGVAVVRMSGGGGCGSAASGVDEAIREAVLAAAPELSDVRVGRATEAAFLPVTSLRVHQPDEAPSHGAGETAGAPSS